METWEKYLAVVKRALGLICNQTLGWIFLCTHLLGMWFRALLKLWVLTADHFNGNYIVQSSREVDLSLEEKITHSK
jgi:hypothetical protein